MFTLGGCVLSLQSCPTLCDPIDSSHQAPLSMGILQARVLKCWRGLSCPPPGDLSNPGIEPFISYVSCIGRGVIYH